MYVHNNQGITSWLPPILRNPYNEGTQCFLKPLNSFFKRMPVGRPRRIWLDSVEADMAELEINREDVHHRKKWRLEVMKRKSNPIGRSKKTQPARGWTDADICTNCVYTIPAPRDGDQIPFFGQAGRHSLPPGWLCSSQMRGTSSQNLNQM